jgi:DNA-directed RNA polymerase specialized sigma24 family protein
LTFRPKNESELDQLDDDDLVNYVVSAREAGETDEFVRATGILVFRRYEAMLGYTMKHEKITRIVDAEDIVGQAIAHAINPTFSGGSAGEFFSRVWTILDRRIIDFLRKQGRSPQTSSLDSYDDGKPDPYVVTPAGGGDFVDGFVLREEWGKVIADMSPRNVEIVRLRAQGYSAKEVIELMQNDGIDGADELTVANVNQVYSRFKRDSRDSLAGDSGNA